MSRALESAGTICAEVVLPSSGSPLRLRLGQRLCLCGQSGSQADRALSGIVSLCARTPRASALCHRGATEAPRRSPQHPPLPVKHRRGVWLHLAVILSPSPTQVPHRGQQASGVWGQGSKVLSSQLQTVCPSGVAGPILSDILICIGKLDFRLLYNIF